MEPLGFCCIIKLTTQIIHRNLAHFLCIAFILALPYAFVQIAFTSSSRNTAQLVIYLLGGGLLGLNGKIPSPPYVYIASFVVPIFFHLLAQPLLTFIVCRAVLNKSIAFKSSLLAVPRLSVLNLIVTVLCVAGVLLGLLCAILILMIIAVGMYIDMVMNFKAVIPWGLVSLAPVIGSLIVVVGGWVYLGIAWSLVNTVAILEEKRGWEAIKRSTYLVEGSKWVVCSLAVLFGGCMMFLPITASDEASVMWRWSCAVSSLGLQAMIALFSMASTVVLYLSCKSRFNEPIDTLIALNSPLGPLETSPKHMDLTPCRFNDPLHTLSHQFGPLESSAKYMTLPLVP